ncbi:hypothetical protein [Actinoalloteichus hymeniacidonis]|uniref:Uncharacterized protein n=1 Tax=Actinoalloteichus hymeniacidonis TaxID=340345 RepID=A0AAC9MZV4_9PSEU|nr:hypothetical protein [Actinoalloteichus hymeniacidonis]AOS64755.1 hypothetical protein TL08_19820 [Actinoalloteichus hymeniacidonis]MBB5907169.1 hypothetical protein [Actinoalloteichus hymeniacidonis]
MAAGYCTCGCAVAAWSLGAPSVPTAREVGLTVADLSGRPPSPRIHNPGLDPSAFDELDELEDHR